VLSSLKASKRAASLASKSTHKAPPFTSIDSNSGQLKTKMKLMNNEVSKKILGVYNHHKQFYNSLRSEFMENNEGMDDDERRTTVNTIIEL